jgi:hypothetical protein
MDWSDTARPLKAHVRNLVADACGKGKTRAIMFPAGQALDVALFLSKGILTKRTKLTAIEGDEDTARKMWRAIFKLGMGPKTKLHKGPASELLVTEETDLAFLDFCGPGTIEEIQWIHDIAPKIVGERSDVFVTLKLNHRGAGFFSTYREFIKSCMAKQLQEEIKAVEGTPTTKVTLDGNVFNEQSTRPSIVALAAQRIALRHLFSKYIGRFDLRHVIYRDLDTTTGKTSGSREMALFHLSNFRDPAKKLLDWR